MSHTYDAKDALRVYEKLNSFIEPMKSLAQSLQEASASQSVGEAFMRAPEPGVELARLFA